MKIVLTRKISVDAFTALMDIGNYRDEYRFFLPVLALGEKETISPSEVNTQLFFTDKDDPRGRLLLERLEKYRLVEPIPESDEDEKEKQTFQLTESGRTALDEGKIPIPESGVFILHGTEDPLFAEPLLACIPKIGADHQHDNGKDSAVNRKTDTENPSWFSRLQKRVIAEPQVIQLAAENNRPIQLISIREPGENMHSPYSVSVQLLVDDSDDTALIVGAHKQGSNTGRTETAVPHKFTCSFSEVFHSLLHDYEEDLVEDDEGVALRVSFDDVKNDPAILVKCRKDIRVPAPKIDGFGRFDDVKIPDVRVIPRRLKDADDWAAWNLQEKIRYYVSPTQFESFREQTAGMWEPHFKAKQILARLPSFDSFIGQCKEKREENPECYWFMTTPTVLTMKEV